MMSISPTGLRQRRARMRKPLAMRNAAARLSAEIPSRNATWRSACGTRLRTGRSMGRSFMLAARVHGRMLADLSERERALIDLAARAARDGGDLAHRLLDRNPPQSLPQQSVEIGGLACRRRARRDPEDRLPTPPAPWPAR